MLKSARSSFDAFSLTHYIVFVKQAKLIAPSILSADFGRLADEIRAVETAGADIIHVDVMDGHFVPNITIGPVVVAAARRATQLPLDVHLMIENPQLYIPEFVKAGANWISVHAEEGYHLDRTLQQIRSLGALAGIALNPATSLAVLDGVIDLADFVLIMTVNPGFGGQSFIEYCKKKISDLRKLIDARGLKTRIEIDGGVGPKNIGELSGLGAEIFVAGSAIFGNKDYTATIAHMKAALK